MALRNLSIRVPVAAFPIVEMKSGAALFCHQLSEADQYAEHASYAPNAKPGNWLLGLQPAEGDGYVEGDEFVTLITPMSACLAGDFAQMTAEETP